MKYGKKYAESIKSYDKQRAYDAGEAVGIVLENAKAKFDETVELHVRLGIDPRQADQQVRGVLVLPNGTGKTKKVLVIAKGERADAAAAAGADYVGAEEMVQKIQTENWFEFDTVIASPDMMGVVGRLGKLTKAQVEEIAKLKMPDLNCTSLESAMSMIKGTARSMGVTVEE